AARRAACRSNGSGHPVRQHRAALHPPPKRVLCRSRARSRNHRPPRWLAVLGGDLLTVGAGEQNAISEVAHQVRVSPTSAGRRLLLVPPWVVFPTRLHSTAGLR